MTTETLEQIALRVEREVYGSVHPGHEDKVIDAARRLVAELSKQQEPIVRIRTPGFRLEWCAPGYGLNNGEAWPDNTPLYLHPDLSAVSKQEMTFEEWWDREDLGPETFINKDHARELWNAAKGEVK